MTSLPTTSRAGGRPTTGGAGASPPLRTRPTTHPPIKGRPSGGGTPAPRGTDPVALLPAAGLPPTTAEPHEVLIQQVLYNAGDGHPDDEWVVLHNVGSQSIALRGWTLADAKVATPLPEAVIAPQGLLVLAAFPGSVATAPAGLPLIVLNHRLGNGLGNTGDRLLLRDGRGHVVDALSWGTDRTVFDPPALLVARGHWLERRNDQDSDTARDWIEAGPPSTDHAPPAVAHDVINSVIPAEPTAVPAIPAPTSPGAALLSQVVLSEIAPDRPFIELYNMEASPIPLGGWELRINGTDIFPLSDDTTIPAHGFVVIDDPDLHLVAQHGSVELTESDGSFADSFQYDTIPAGLSASRYPAHGGGWQIGTPLTPGTWNLPAGPPTPGRDPAPSTTTGPAPGGAVARQSVGSSWTLYNTGLPLMIVMAAGGLLFHLWRRWL